MKEFLKKIESRSIKMARVNSILSTKSINLQFFTLILYCFMVSCDLGRFSVLSPFIDKSMLKTMNIKCLFFMQVPSQITQ